MEFASVIFPAPDPSYTYETAKGHLIFIPRARIINGFSVFRSPADFGKEARYIPCWFHKYEPAASKLVLYLHGNAEDVGIAKDLAEDIAEYLSAHLVCMEYPGYGIYPGIPEAGRIARDALNVFDYIAYECGWGRENIIVVGRSIGTGPAVQVAAMRHPCALMLISAFTSVKGIVQSVASTFFKPFVKERYKNYDIIKHVKCRTFLVHGKADRLIPCRHSMLLKEACGAKECELVTPDKMDHNEFNAERDVEAPFRSFLERHGVSFAVKPEACPALNLPKGIHELPPNYPPPTKRGFFATLIRSLV